MGGLLTLKTVKSMKIKKDWENCSKLKIKETRELDAMHDPGLDPFGLKNIIWATNKTWMRALSKTYTEVLKTFS